MLAELDENNISGRMTKKLWMSIGFLSGCALLTSIYRAAFIGTLQGTYPADGQTINQLRNTANTEIQTLNNIPVQRGTGTYKLKTPNGVNKGTPSWSQYGQDIFVDKLFNRKHNGFFVEIGGFDGETYSNSLFFEKKREWSGLLVEANPYSYGLMVEKDRNCFMVNACISNTISSMTFIIGGPLTSVKDITSNRHRQRIDSKAVLRTTDERWGHSNENIVVKCYPLMALMNTLGQTKIDYFSLDVEGAEMIILHSIDWDKLDIDVFTIETEQHREDILTFMKSRGYKWIQTILGDDVFKKK